MAKCYVHMDATEKRLIQGMKKAGVTWSKIEEITGRSSGSLSRVLKGPPVKKDGGAGTKAKNKGGRKATILSRADVKALVKAMEKLQKEANAEQEVTVSMIMEAAGVEACAKTVLAAFHGEGIWFANLKERQTLSEQDVKERFIWAKKHQTRSKDAWVKRPHAIIDNKHFQLFTEGKGRSHAAKRSVRGAYQKRGEVPKTWLVKPKKHIKFPAKGVQVTAAVIKGRIRMWDYVDGNWNGESAAAMYSGPLNKALTKAYPNIAAKPYAKWQVLEDNDPAGYKSSKGTLAKEATGIVTLDLPRRNPDLNVLDYCLWHEINQRMRQAERGFPKDKKETADEYKARLRRTALGLPTALVTKAVKDMRRRTQDLVNVKGRLFKE
jgi:hypothetical protein